MKRTEYADVHIPSADEKLHELETGKHDDYELPEFTKEVPVSSSRHESGGSVTMEYGWKKSDTPSIKITRMTFRGGEEGVADLYRIAARDGADSICFSHNNHTYIIRKTAHEIAQALYNAYDKIKGALENIVGYFHTALGNDYVMAKAETDSWAFDRRIAKAGIQYVDAEALGSRSKSRLTEIITEKIADLHAANLIIGSFTLNNIIFAGTDLRLSDLRKLRVSRKKSYVIEEFKNILQYLFAIGFATREDVYCAIAYYASKNEGNCAEWYRERTGKKAADSYDVASRMEEEVYG